MRSTLAEQQEAPVVQPAPRCFACGARGPVLFYEVRGVPAVAHAVCSTRAQALSVPRADLDLAFCPGCGFVQNLAFDPSLAVPAHAHAGPSPVDAYRARHDLAGAHVLEIGCGDGTFLQELCDLTGASGTGIDPEAPASNDAVTFIRDVYSFRHRDLEADLVVCRGTLQGVQPVAEFVRVVRQHVERRSGAASFEVRDARAALSASAFWELSYQSCSAFSMGSLARLLAGEGYAVTWAGRSDGSIVLDARPAPRPRGLHPSFGDVEVLASSVEAFAASAPASAACWRKVCVDAHRAGERVALWGSVPRSVSFLSTLGLTEQVTTVVDPDPRAHGGFLPGTGHEVASPADLLAEPPDVVITLNSHPGDVSKALDDLDVHAEVLAA